MTGKTGTKKNSRTITTPSLDTMDIYMKQARQKDVLTREQEAELVALAAAGNEEARRDLVAANLRFVVKIAHEYRGYKVPIGDLVQEGNIGFAGGQQVRPIQRLPAHQLRSVLDPFGDSRVHHAQLVDG